MSFHNSEYEDYSLLEWDDMFGRHVPVLPCSLVDDYLYCHVVWQKELYSEDVRNIHMKFI